MASIKNRNYHHGDLRAALISGGLHLIAEKGMRGLTLREIGSHVGVSRTAAYRHFADKSELLAAIREAGFEKFADALERAREQSGPQFATRMGALALAYVRFAREHSAYFEVMFGAGGCRVPACIPAATDAESRAFGVLQQTILEGQRRGEVHLGDSYLLACTAWAMVHGIAALRLDANHAGARPSDEFVLRCASVLLTGLQSTREGSVKGATGVSL